jgi:GT2 family glycosyltransferase
MRISVVIPTLNDVTLSQTLDAVCRQSRTADEIIVVGRDDARRVEQFIGVDFVDTGKPVCAAAARNLGIMRSSGDIIVFTDSDCIPAPDWLEQHEKAHREGRSVVGGGVSLGGINYWAQADNVAMFHEFLTQTSAGSRLLLPTLNLSVARRVIDTVGYMDESFPGAAAEDTDWTIRMRLSGHRLHFEPAAAVHHAPNRTSWSDVFGHWKRSGYSGIRVRLRYATDYRTPRFVHSAMLLRLLSPLIAARVTLGIYLRPAFWRYLLYTPVVYATKIAYCLGAAQSIENGFAFEETMSLPDPV